MMMRLFPEVLRHARAMHPAQATTRTLLLEKIVMGNLRTQPRDPTTTGAHARRVQLGVLRAHFPSAPTWASSSSRPRTYFRPEATRSSQPTTMKPQRVHVLYRRVQRRFLTIRAPFRDDSIDRACPGCSPALPCRAGEAGQCLGTGVADDKSIYPYVGDHPLLPRRGAVLNNVQTFVAPEVDLRCSARRLDGARRRRGPRPPAAMGVPASTMATRTRRPPRALRADPGPSSRSRRWSRPAPTLIRAARQRPAHGPAAVRAARAGEPGEPAGLLGSRSAKDRSWSTRRRTAARRTRGCWPG